MIMNPPIYQRISIAFRRMISSGQPGQKIAIIACSLLISLMGGLYGDRLLSLESFKGAISIREQFSEDKEKLALWSDEQLASHRILTVDIIADCETRLH